jgi:hypothetical protein
MNYFNDNIFLGVVEDNSDPERENRIKVRVINVFDGIPVEDIPWATPFKDHNGVQCNLPDVGKVVSIQFENGDIYNPIYRYSEHYNVNLKEKLKSLSEEDYLSMKALLFDHKTQIYVNESEGLKMDHKFNLMNITKDSINIALKDNFGSVNIGTADATQQAILGNNFLDWFDVFIDHLLGSQGGPYYGNLLAPVVPHPGLITHLLQYKALKDPKFLSHNVNFNDNGYVDKLDRINNTQEGDSWVSTKEENNLTSVKPNNYSPKEGSKESTPSNLNEEIEETTDINIDVITLINLLQNKGYEIFTNPYKMNIVGVRFQYEGSEYSNKFNDKMYVFYKDDENKWLIKNFKISTMPGKEIEITTDEYKLFKETVDSSIIGTKISMKKYSKYIGKPGLTILQPAQYINTYKLGYSPKTGEYKSKALVPVSDQAVFIDNDIDNKNINYSSEDQGNFNIEIKRGFPGGTNVDNWSKNGEQVFKTSNSLSSFINLMELHEQRNNNQFTYTLVTSEDYEESSLQIQSLSREEQEDLQNI